MRATALPPHPLETLPARGPGPAAPARLDAPAARRSLHEQIAHLERRLGAVEGERPRGRRARGPWLLSLGELERVRDRLVATVHAAEAAAVERADAHAAARARLAAMLADPPSHRWERVTRQDLGEPGCGAYHVRPRAGLLGMLAGWWEVKLSSGCP